MAAETKELNALHAKLAQHMARALEQQDTAKLLITDFPDLPEPVIKFLENAASDNPALMTVIAKFLKDNSITSAPEESKDLTEIQKLLKNKRSRIETLPAQGIQ